MADQKYNTDDPILIVIKRGRNNKGYIISPADNDSPCPCLSAEDIGEAIIELLEDEAQPRLDANSVGKSSQKTQEAPVPGSEQKQEAAPESEPEEAEEYEDNPYAGQSATYESMDPVDKAVVSGLSWLINKAKSGSAKSRGPGSR